ncbi:zinc finger C3H1 domain-containing protein-like isoform X2 [Melanotaenia boesemani]|uniref:zinc finger C3H1 domain-containing protein-like isoform X2 n=1 Tax=Melanotaenia boesemani TaxID=1250792 RepID=UPI001C04EC76|nr:zinc finger C3H1 domain-containing protein-like isoform X2 [Melanotaenia boesemani]
MDSDKPTRSPVEDGELEDGEICDDEIEVRVPMRRGEGCRPRGRGRPRTRKPHQHPLHMRPPPAHHLPEFHHRMPYNPGPHVHGPFPPSHRQQCGPSGPDRPSAPSGPPAMPPPGLGLLSEPTPRSNFWERSHGTLGRFRHRSVPNGGRGGWNRGSLGVNSRVAPGRYGPGESHISPSRKQKQLGRNRVRKVVPGISRPDSAVDESFEDLLSKYKQIQLELECIRKEETMALDSGASPIGEDVLNSTPGPPEAKLGPEPVPDQVTVEELSEQEEEKKVFQAFNIKPLRQKLPTPADLDELHRKWVGQDVGGGADETGSIEEAGGDAAADTEATDTQEEKAPNAASCLSESSASSEESNVSPDKPVEKVEEEELSELQLRLLALQSASKKWQQKEQQVMKRSKDRILKSAQEKSSSSASGSGSGAVALGRQRITTRSASFAAAAAAEKSRTRAKPVDRDRDRTKTGSSPAEKERLSERDRSKQSPKLGPKAVLEKVRTLGKPHTTKKLLSPGEQRFSEGGAEPAKEAEDRTKSGPRPERDRPTQSPKPGSKGTLERGRTPGRPPTTKKLISPNSTSKQAVRKQQLRTWKMQQQRKQEEKRRQEEEERRKREDEIRRIRDLSNQDEQYNRFMKLVGGKRTRSKSRDQDHRKSVGKPSLDASGNMYQYDNYDEVAMDTDSETSSPVPSPTRNMLSADESGCFLPPCLHSTEGAAFRMDISQPFLPPLQSGVPPPPPPLPPPPDELEPPPKPPFADEEEEEEMLLRETCLMSMANKRVVTTECSSGPPSPSCPPPADVQLPPRGNLSTVSLNSVPQSRSSRFTRTHHAGRTPLVLPRHKSVVVSLNDSDDSDSDLDSCSSSQTVFGGLEFMIKEARRTVEAAKPKASSGCEKENNPVRTPEALPEDKRVEYRMLKEEIASREKQRMLKDHILNPAGPEPVLNQSLKPTLEVKLSEVEQRLSKHRELLQRDEAVLRHLLQQELKKTESLKATEDKVSKLREQLQASEKIVVANRTLLKKLQEQVQRVEQRVSLKKTVAVRLEQELVQAQLAAGRRPKRLTDSSQTMPRKLQRLDPAPRGSERNFAELIAQKRRLQQLESEYALKIQKLKEAQALRNKGAPPEPPPELPVRASTPPPNPRVQQLPPSVPFHLPQPSLHDLSQDKLTLDSEDIPEADDQEPEPAPAAPAPATKSGRRPSLRQSNSSFTKPHLDAPGATPAKDASNAKPAKTAGGSELPAEMFAGLDVDGLKRRYQQQARLEDLLQRELHMLGGDTDNFHTVKVVPPDVETTNPSGGSELKPIPFQTYYSPLLVFRSYRFSPYYRTKEKLSLSSVSYSNAIQANKCFCRFDLTGTCNDDGCKWQHMRNCTLSGNQLFQDILSYNLSLIGCSEKSSDEEICAATENYLKKLFGPNKDRMGVDQKAVLLVSKVNESKRHVPPFTTCKDPRRWKPKPSAPSSGGPHDDSGDEAVPEHLTPTDDICTISSSAVDVCITSEDRRYFVSETDDISNLEASVLESPRDTQLWIKLAFRYLNQSETSAAECLEAALNTLSRALESNCEDPEVWSHYLSLFSRRGSREEVQEMCEMAVEHAPDYRVWCNYLNLENSFEGKDYVCERLLHFLLVESSLGVTEKLSFQLMEALLFRVQLNLFTGRMESALALLQNALKSTQDWSIADHLTTSDRALLWLSYIHLTEFDRLPSSLYDPAESGPARLVNRESFMLPWRTAQDISTPPDILIALFQDAVHQCSDESMSERESTLACMPLNTNLILLYKLLQRFDEAVSLCCSLLDSCPDFCVLRDALAELHLSRGKAEVAVSMWLHALAECPHNAQVFYHCCKFLMTQDQSSAIPPLFRGFILSLCEGEQRTRTPVDVLRHILGFSSEAVLSGPIIKEQLQEQLNQQMAFLHLLHCRWMWLHGSVEDAVAAFERALGSSLQLQELHTLWMDYLLFSCSPQAGSVSRKMFPELLQRCLSTVPTRLEPPFNPAEYWSCYRFHNKVVVLYLKSVPQSQRALVLERLRNLMPNNTELSLRLLYQDWEDGNMEQLKFQARMLTSSAPKCVSSWRIAVAVEKELKERGEMRLLYQQALQTLPLCAALWKDRLLFEAAEGGASDRLQRLVDVCQQAGVNVSIGGVGLSIDL